MPLRRLPHRPGVSLLPRAAIVVPALLLAACGTSRPVTAPTAASDEARRAALSAEQGGTMVRGTVGIPPFAASRNDTTITPLAYALADLLATDLSRSSQVRVVERARLGEVLRELDLASTGRVDSATAPRVGKLVSAERLVFGSIQAMPDGRTLRLGARVGDVERSTLSRAIDASAPLAEILAAEKVLALRLFESLGVQLTPAERAAVEQQATKNIKALLAYGRGVQRYYEGDFRGAAREFRAAARLDPSFRDARNRELQVRSFGAIGTATPVVIPGVRPLDGAIASTIDRLNRPLDLVSNVSRAVSTVLDPSFPTSQTGTIVITIGRP